MRILALSLILLLVACSAEDPDNSYQPPERNYCSFYVGQTVWNKQGREGMVLWIRRDCKVVGVSFEGIEDRVYMRVENLKLSDN